MFGSQKRKRRKMREEKELVLQIILKLLHPERDGLATMVALLCVFTSAIINNNQQAELLGNGGQGLNPVTFIVIVAYLYLF